MVGATVRVGGLVLDVREDGFVLDDGTEHAAVVLREEAADWMVTAARTRPVRIAPRMAVTAKALDSVAPGLLGAIMKRGVVEPS